MRFMMLLKSDEKTEAGAFPDEAEREFRERQAARQEIPRSKGEAA